jgi:hypothetical protein
MLSNTLAKEFIHHHKTLPNSNRVISSPANLTDITASPQTTPITEKIIHFENIDRNSRIQEREVGWWIGKVTAIHEETFDAVMEDLSGNINVVELEKELIDPHEQDLLFINSKFTYAISRIDKPDGREYKTKFSFSSRRKWLKEYEIEAKRLADEFFPDSLLSL